MAFISTTHAEVVLLSDIHMALGKVRRFEKDPLINAGQAAPAQAYRVKWQAAIDQVGDTSRKLAATGTAGGPAPRHGGGPGAQPVPAGHGASPQAGLNPLAQGWLIAVNHRFIGRLAGRYPPKTARPIH